MRGKTRDSSASLENCDRPISCPFQYLIFKGLFDRVMILFEINVETFFKVSAECLGGITTENIPPFKLYVLLRVVWVDLGFEIAIDIMASESSRIRHDDNCRIVIFVAILFAAVDV